MDDRFPELLEQRHNRLRSGQESGGSEVEPTTEVKRRLDEAEDCLRLIERVRRGQVCPTNPATDPESRLIGSTGPELGRIGRFEIIVELGRGAHGIVFLAWDPAAQRQVAVKTPHPDVLFTPELRERFLREGIAAARLAHTNIISVLEVDQSGPVCYIVSTFCKGRSLAALLGETTQPLSPRLASQWMAQLADAVEHAHRRGILHRDLKPANVVLEPGPVGLGNGDESSGTPTGPEGIGMVPKLTDFGLAKLVDSQDMRSRTGVLLGTPAYMAPEQVDASLRTIGPATDVYGLGAMLYELLTLRPPFLADSQADLLRQIAAGDPRAPRQWHRDLPRDLEAICLRCLQRRPPDRYPSAAALVADLRRFLAGDVTWARPLGFAGRSLKWARRRPAAAAVLAVSVLAVSVLAMGAIWHFVQMGRALEVAQEARAQAEQRGQELQQMIYVSDLQGAQRALEQQEVRKASYLLGRNRPAEGAHGGFLWRYLTARCHGQPRRLVAHRGHAHSVEFSPDGQTLLTAGSDGDLSIWEVASGRRRATLRSGAREVNFACYSPDGKTIAAAETGGKIRLWNAEQERTLSVWDSLELKQINCLAWSADGCHLAAAGFPGESFVVWEVATGQAWVMPLGHSDEVNSLAYSADGRRLATASSDETVSIWDFGGSERARLKPDQTHVTCVRFSPDSQVLATSGASGTVKIWNVADGSLAATYEANSERVDALAFSPHGPVVAISDHFGIVREWDWKNDRIVRVIDSGQGRILSLDYSRATNTLASAAREGSLCVWDLATEVPSREIASSGFLGSLAFTQDSRRLVFAGPSTGVSVLDLDTFSKRVLETDSPSPVAHLATVGARVFLLRDDRLSLSVLQADLAGSGPLVTVATVAAKIDTMLVTPDGRLLLTVDHDAPHRVRLWDAETGRFRQVLSEHHFPIHCFACAPSSDVAATAGADGGIRLWDLKGAKLLRTLDGHSALVSSLSFASDGRTLASADDDRVVRFWDVMTGEPVRVVLNHVARVKSVAFCPDEPLIATGDEQGFVRIWSPSNGEEVVVLGQLRATVGSLAFSPDGQWLAAGTWADKDPQELRIWSARYRDPTKESRQTR